jgi:DNA-binding PadR family transcriptional regulator
MGAGSLDVQQAAPMHSPVNWALLGLVIERPSYAYELARRFERAYEGALSISSVSHIYTALAALRERGLVEELPGTPQSTRSRRRYQPTARGLHEHAEWLVGQLGEERRRQRVLIVQLGALAKAPEQALAALDAYEQACIAEIAAASPPGEDDGPGTTRLVARLTGEDTRLTIAARLRWVQYARTQLQALPAHPESG